MRQKCTGTKTRPPDSPPTGPGRSAGHTSQPAAVWADDRRGSSFGLDWAGPFHAPTITAQASALDVLTTQIPALARPARA